jgi:hypothetical protein
MENVTELMKYIETDLLNFNRNIIFKIKDICLKNYNYKPRFNEVNIIIHEWNHKENNSILTLDSVRKFLTEDLFEIMSELQSKYLSEAQHFEPSDEIHENFQRKIKKIAEICIMIEKRVLFKEFIDFYRDGYFN